MFLTASHSPAHRPLQHRLKIAALCAALLLTLAVNAQTTTTTTTAARAIELKADKLPSAAVVGTVAAGATLRLLSLEGGWAYVELASSGANQAGWVRASALNLQSGGSAVSATNTGRLATGSTVNAALTLGVRSLPARRDRKSVV